MKKWPTPIVGGMSFFIFLFTLFFVCPTFSQSYLNFRTFDKLPSFPSTNFYGITQDDFGYLWLATRDGLYTFDGTVFEPAHTPVDSNRILPQQAFYNVFHDSQGNIWGGTYSGGLYRVNVRKNKAFHYLASMNENSLPDNRIKAVYEDTEGRIWVGCHKEGFCLYRPETDDFKRYKPSQLLGKESAERFIDDILCFHFQDGALWVGTLDKLLRFDPLTEKLEYHDYTENIENPNAVNVAINGVKDMVRISDDLILFHAYARIPLAFVYNVKSRTTKVVRLKELPINSNGVASSIFQDDENVYYLMGNKMARLNTVDWTSDWLFNSVEYSNLEFSIGSFFKDNDGGLWALGKKNLYHLKDSTDFAVVHGVPNYGSEILELDEQYLFYLDDAEARGGLYDLENKTNLPYKFQLTGVPKNNRRLSGIFKSGSVHVYAHSDGRIYKWNEASGNFESVWHYPSIFNETSSESIMSGYLDTKGHYWLGTKNNGILRVNLQTKETKQYKNEPENGREEIVYNGYPQGFFQDESDNIWYGTDVGFGYFSYTENRFVNFPFSSYSTDDNSFPLKGIESIKRDWQGRIWLADHHHGLGYFIFGEDEPKIEIISEADGLWDCHVHDMVIDKWGDLWVSHWKGISRIRSVDLSIENYGFELGFTFNSDLLPLDDGGLLVSKGGQIQKIWPDKIKELEVYPEVVIKDFKVFDEALNFGKNWNEVEKVNLSYEQDFFSIDFGTINFQNPDMEEIQYQVSKGEGQWVNAGDRKYVSFANMDGGDYQFKLRARLKGRKWGETKILNISISHPYWQTWWFYLLCFLIVAGLLFSFYKYRIKKIKEKEELKNQFKIQLAEVEMTALRAQMNPHFLFNCLNSIKLFIVESNTKSASEYLTKFAKLIRLILQNSKNKMVRLSDELEALELYVEMEKMRFDHQFEYSIKIAPEINAEELEIPPLLLQPYVENAIWHGLVHTEKANRLLISIEKSETDLVCVIEDNGIGREAAQKRKKGRESHKQSLGMEITKNRIDLSRELYQMDTTVSIIDLKNKNEVVGTRVVLMMKDVH